MTTLQKIVTAAKKLRKQYPNRYPKWTDYIKAASKEIKKPGKKIADVNVTYRSKKEADYLVERKKDGRFKGTVRLAGVKKKPVAKKKPAAVKKHTDTKSHNIKISIGGMDAAQTLRELENWKRIVSSLKDELKTAPIYNKLSIKQDIALANKWVAVKKSQLKKQLK
jgi:hypothetical protein